MIFHLNGDTVRIGETPASKCPYLQFDPEAGKVRVEFHDDEYNIMLPNGWHRYRSVKTGLANRGSGWELEIDRELIEPLPAPSVSVSWDADGWSHGISGGGILMFNCGGTTNSVGCETITVGSTTMIDGNSSTGNTFNDTNNKCWWTIFASAAAGGQTEPETPKEKESSKPKDDWEGKTRRRTDDNLREFFGG